MTKILLVEDDKSLREIYGVRLLAEGYEIVSAGDGEEALAAAIKERPDLVLSDVMMPKISGFDMLDILRATPETKDIKVIMMTALSSEDQRARGESLGADRYLVKSQVGIEDVVRTVHDVLADAPVAAGAPNAFATPAPSAVPSPAPAPQPAAPAPVAPQSIPVTDFVAPAPAAPEPPVINTPPTPAPIIEEAPIMQPADQPSAPIAPQGPGLAPAPTPQPAAPAFEAPAPVAVDAVPPTPVAAPVAPEPVAPAPVFEMPVPAAAPPPPMPLPQPTAPFSSPAPASLGDRIVNPVEPTGVPQPDIAALMSQELNGTAPSPDPQQTPPQV
ncbi:MAG TPA: response regulator [Candidatus Saccharimonadales bacterium]|nr:response regulator [Candidatus Saccharimonadales bacterium]